MPTGVYLRTDYHRKINSLGHKGQVPWHKGKVGVYSEEVNKRRSNKHKGMKKPWVSKNMKQSLGEKAPNWRGGISPINLKIRGSLEYRLWRKAVFERDNHTCIWCGKKEGIIHADHIKPFALYPKLRFAIDNGRTLCIDCHKTTETFAGRGRLKTK